MSITDYIDQAARILFDDLGIDEPTARRWFDGVSLAALAGHWRPMAAVSVSPRMCGPLAPMFASITVEILAGYHAASDTGHLRYCYSYTHPDGSRNGHEVARKFPLDAGGTQAAEDIRCLLSLKTIDDIRAEVNAMKAAELGAIAAHLGLGDAANRKSLQGIVGDRLIEMKKTRA